MKKTEPTPPKGWKLVPTVPTPEMLAAMETDAEYRFFAVETYGTIGIPKETCAEIYIAMLGAAPVYQEQTPVTGPAISVPLNVLEREALDDIANWCSRPAHSPYFWKQKSMTKLEARGFVRRTGHVVGDQIGYIITEAGREHHAKL